MNDFHLVSLVLAYIPLKAALLFIAGFAIVRGLKLETRNTAEVIALSLTFGFAAVYLFMLAVVFGGLVSNELCVAAAVFVLIGGTAWALTSYFNGSLKSGWQWLQTDGAVPSSLQLPKPFYWLAAATLLVLAILTAAVPSLDFEVFRWLRPINSALQNGGYVEQREEIMFWLPQTAQWTDGFTLAIAGDISFVAADRIIAMATIFFSLQALSLRIFGRDFAPLAFAILIANETGSYLFPHAFLKGHLMGAVYGTAAVLLYFSNEVRPSAGPAKLVAAGVLTGIAASVTFHTVFLPVAMGLHALFEFVGRQRRRPFDPRRWTDFLAGAFALFVPAALLASVWIVRNILMTGHVTYPYGIYFPASGGFGTAGSFGDYLITHMELAKPFGFAFNGHTIGPFLAAGFVGSIIGRLFVRQPLPRRFFVFTALISLSAFICSYFMSNISARYYMYWMALLSLCASAPLAAIWFSNASRPIVRTTSMAVLLTAATCGIGYFTLRPALDQVATGAIAGDFRRVTPQPESIISVANGIIEREPDSKWATPLMMGADYYLKTSNVVSYGWPPFPTALRLLAAQEPSSAYEALKEEQVDYIMFFRIMPSNLYSVYDWDSVQHKTIRIPYGEPHKSSLRRTLAVFQTDDNGVLLKFDGRYLEPLFVSEPFCAYPDRTGCLSGDVSRERHFLFAVRDTPDPGSSWIDINTIIEAENIP